jgi:hypothetical protein
VGFPTEAFDVSPTFLRFPILAHLFAGECSTEFSKLGRVADPKGKTAPFAPIR